MKLTYSCKKVAELLLQSQDEPLGIVQQAKLKVHLLCCGYCQNFGDQLRAIRELVSDPHLFEEPAAPGVHQPGE